ILPLAGTADRGTQNPPPPRAPATSADRAARLCSGFRNPTPHPTIAGSPESTPRPLATTRRNTPCPRLGLAPRCPPHRYRRKDQPKLCRQVRRHCPPPAHQTAFPSAGPTLAGYPCPATSAMGGCDTVLR